MPLESKDIMTLLELLSSRICHDLVSPVGAINNGLEFMSESADDPDALKEATDLIAHSAAAAGARLMAFRIVYGAGGRDGNLKPEDIQRAFGTLIRSDGKIRQSWDPFGPLGLSPSLTGFCKTLLGTLILAQECLVKGGTVYVDPGKGEQTLIRAEGAGVTIRENVREAVHGDLTPESLDPRLVHPYVLGMIARTYGFSVALESQDENSVVWSLTRHE